MLTYVKLFNTILSSSVWSEDHPTRIVWITMLAMADADGIVRASVPGLAHYAAVDKEECRVALAKFMAPDPDSTSKVEEGRRIKEVPGGWKLVNHAHYVKLMGYDHQLAYWRQKKRESRAKINQLDNGKTIRQVLRERSEAEQRLGAEGIDLHETPPPYRTGTNDDHRSI